jgi:hypothetical protein
MEPFIEQSGPPHNHRAGAGVRGLVEPWARSGGLLSLPSQAPRALERAGGLSLGCRNRVVLTVFDVPGFWIRNDMKKTLNLTERIW